VGHRGAQRGSVVAGALAPRTHDGAWSCYIGVVLSLFLPLQQNSIFVAMHERNPLTGRIKLIPIAVAVAFPVPVLCVHVHDLDRMHQLSRIASGRYWIGLAASMYSKCNRLPLCPSGAYSIFNTQHSSLHVNEPTEN